MARPAALSPYVAVAAIIGSITLLLQRGQLLLWPLCIFLLVRFVLPAGDACGESGSPEPEDAKRVSRGGRLM